MFVRELGVHRPPACLPKLSRPAIMLVLMSFRRLRSATWWMGLCLGDPGEAEHHVHGVRSSVSRQGSGHLGLGPPGDIGGRARFPQLPQKLHPRPLTPTHHERWHCALCRTLPCCEVLVCCTRPPAPSVGFAACSMTHWLPCPPTAPTPTVRLLQVAVVAATVAGPRSVGQIALRDAQLLGKCGLLQTMAPRAAGMQPQPLRSQSSGPAPPRSQSRGTVLGHEKWQC